MGFKACGRQGSNLVFPENVVSYEITLLLYYRKKPQTKTKPPHPQNTHTQS